MISAGDRYYATNRKFDGVLTACVVDRGPDREWDKVECWIEGWKNDISRAINIAKALNAKENTKGGE